MKDKFIGYYPPTVKEIDLVWKEGLISIDANTLLHLYRYTESTRENFLQILNELKGRLWIPYQAAYEFHNNRRGVIQGQEEAYGVIQGLLDNQLEEITKQLNRYEKHPKIKVEDFQREIEKAFNKIKFSLDSQRKAHPEHLKDSKILDEISAILDKKIGNQFSKSELVQIYLEGKTRYDEDIPPGYYDRATKKNKGDQHLYGDLIIWKELIKKIKIEKKQIIFVTDDRKEDWWKKYKGETVGPREELIKEFYDETGVRILIYQADTFLRYANEKLGLKIKEETIAEVKEVRIKEEKNYIKLFDWQKSIGINDNNSIAINKDTGLYINPNSAVTWNDLTSVKKTNSGIYWSDFAGIKNSISGISLTDIIGSKNPNSGISWSDLAGIKNSTSGISFTDIAGSKDPNSGIDFDSSKKAEDKLDETIAKKPGGDSNTSTIDI
jgi:hypothetical protein